MIYHPKVKTRGVAFTPDPGFGETGIHASDLISLTEGTLHKPSAVLEALAQTKLSWVNEVFTGSETIKYSDPPDALYRDIRALQASIEKRSREGVAAWRKRKNAAVAAIRRALSERVPVFKYKEEWRVKTVTYVKKLRLPLALGIELENSGSPPLRYGTVDYQRVIDAANNLGPFDKARVARVSVTKTFGYWANVRYVARYRTVIRDRKVLNERIADWVRKNPPYSPGKDPGLSADRQKLYALKLRRSGQYNQCAACKDTSAVGAVAELRSAARAMIAQYLVDPAVLNLGGCITGRSDLQGHSFPGFVVREEWWRPPYQESNGDIVEGQWITGVDYSEIWAERLGEHEWQSKTPTDNETQAKLFLGNSDPTVHQMIDGRVWPCTSGLSPFEVSNATDNAVLNVQAGGKNPFEWNFVRSAVELKDSSATYRYAKEFLQQIAKRKFSSLYTVKSAASAYLTYKFGIEPTAADVGQLLGTSRTLLKHTYPTLRTLAAYAEGAALATMTGRSAVSFGTIDYKSLFASRLDVIYPYDALDVRTLWVADYDDRLGFVSAYSPTLPLASCQRQSMRGTRTSITEDQWDILERANAAPKWVWVPESGVAFQRYSADKVRKALGTSFSEIFDSLDSLTTGWEVLPLSFVVDWFTNVRSAIQAMDNFIHADLLDLSPDGEGAWYSMRFRLMLACPIYRKRGNPRSITVTVNSSKTQFETIEGGSKKYRFTVIRPESGSIRVISDLEGVNLMKTNITAYARNLLEDAPLTALIPKLKVSLNRGKLGSLLALLQS